uniref:Uncharacterized protein n=1 Tax=Rhizophora mucronata TaxID=61149 RepID=A0A2P2IY58_RHIMU
MAVGIMPFVFGTTPSTI